MLTRQSLRFSGLKKYFRCWSLTAAAGAVLLLTGNGAWAADEIFTARTAITLPGMQKITSFDLGFVDPVIGLYLLADRTNNAVDVIDTTMSWFSLQRENLSGPPPPAPALTSIAAQARMAC